MQTSAGGFARAPLVDRRVANTPRGVDGEFVKLGLEITCQVSRAIARCETTVFHSSRITGVWVAPGCQSQLGARIGEVGIGLDPGDVCAVRIAYGLEQVQLRRRADLVRLLSQESGVLARPGLRACRAAGGDVRVHRVPVAVNGIAGEKARALLRGASRGRGRVLR